MLRLLIFLSIGILIRTATPPPYLQVLYIPLFLLILILLYRLRKRSDARLRAFQTTEALLALLALGIGMVRAELSLRSHAPSALLEQITAITQEDDTNERHQAEAVLRLTTPAERRENSIRLRAEVLRLRMASVGIDSTLARPARLMLYLPADSTTDGLNVGQLLAARLALYPITNSGNPDSYDYAALMYRQGYTTAAYTTNYQLLLTETEKPTRLERIRQQIGLRIDALLTTPTRRALMRAMLLGQRADLPDTLRDAMARAGLAHILAVSGLHTGILLLLVMALLTPIRLLRGHRLAAAIAIAAIWGYALLTGGAASVVRAATMISLTLGARILRRDSNPLSALALTACIMLLANPTYLTDAGFQLSFLSVLSILLYSRPIGRAMGTWGGIAGHWIRQALSTTLAAQVLTLPLCTWLFHIVPLWFVPANFIVLPLLAPLLLLNIGVIVLQSVGLAVPLLASAANLLTETVIRLGSQSATLPALRPFFPSELELWLLYGLVILLTLSISTGRARALACALRTAIVLLLLPMFSDRDNPHREIICFNHRRSNALHLIAGDTHYIINPDSTAPPSSLYQTMAARRQLKAPQLLPSDTTIAEVIAVKGPLVAVGDVRLYLLTNDSLRTQAPTTPLPTNYLLMGGRGRTSLHEAKRLVKPDTLVLLASLPQWRRKRLKAEADSIGLPTCDLSLQGAWRLPLPAVRY